MHVDKGIILLLTASHLSPVNQLLVNLFTH